MDYKGLRESEDREVRRDTMILGSRRVNGHLGVRRFQLFGHVMNYGHLWYILTDVYDFSIIFPDFS